MIRSRFAFAIVLLVALPCFGAYAGRPLAGVLAELQARGLHIVYSSSLVKPDMRVKAEPVATEPRRLLDEILAPHGLVSKDGPGGVILIVEAPPKKEEPKAAPAPAKMPVALASIVVTPSDYSLLGGQPEERQFLTRKDLDHLPHLGDDVFRAMSRLPGVTATEVSAPLLVRGGAANDVLVLLDGVELYEPFHIKDFNVFSIVDTEAIGSVEFLSGGFPAEYGDRMGAVIDLGSGSPSARRTYVGASFSHARLLSEGRFDGDRGEWLVSARRGYLDVVLNLVHATEGTPVTPRYYDIFGKLQHRMGEKSVVSFDVLAALDHVRYHSSNELADSSYGNEYAWMNVRTSYTPRLSSQTVASIGRVHGRRYGDFERASETASVKEHRSFSVAGVKQDWTLDLSERRQYFKWGFDAKHFNADYDYASSSVIRSTPVQFPMEPIVSSRNLSIGPDGNSFAIYAADRLRIAPSLVAEAGARWERESWSGGGEVSPRMNVVYTPAGSWAIRASWGRYRQPQAMNELHVEDGETTFGRAEIAEQTALGIEHPIPGGISVRLDAYRKEISRVRPRYENLFDPLTFFPEVGYDRVRIVPESAFARGVELTAKTDDRRNVSWWISVARSRAVDRIGGVDVPRPWDQPIAASFSVNYRKSDVWNFNVSGLYHSGWPTTDVTAIYVPNRSTVTPVVGPRNGDRLPAYSRIDVRASRSIAFSRGTFSSSLEVMNVLNRHNPLATSGFAYSYDPRAGTATVHQNRNFLGWLPSFGVAWEF